MLGGCPRAQLHSWQAALEPCVGVVAPPPLPTTRMLRPLLTVPSSAAYLWWYGRGLRSWAGVEAAVAGGTLSVSSRVAFCVRHWRDLTADVPQQEVEQMRQGVMQVGGAGWLVSRMCCLISLLG